MFLRLIITVTCFLLVGICLAQDKPGGDQPPNCKCPPPPPPPPAGGDGPQPPAPAGDMDMDMDNSDVDAPPPPPPQEQNKTVMDGKSRPPPPPPPKHGHHKNHKVCGTDGKEYADRCQFVNAQGKDSSLGERPCVPKAVPHCLTNGTTLQIDRHELDKILKSSPISLGLLCPGPCPCQLKCPPPPPPPHDHGPGPMDRGMPKHSKTH